MTNNHLSRLNLLVMQPKNNGRINKVFPCENLLIVAAVSETPWHVDIVNQQACKVFPTINYQAKKRLMYEARKYFWDDPYLFKVCGDNMVRRCVAYEEVSFILNYWHSFEVRGHLGISRIAHKVLQCGFFWPTIHGVIMHLQLLVLDVNALGHYLGRWKCPKIACLLLKCLMCGG